jgi:hypothetical protein
VTDVEQHDTLVSSTTTAVDGAQLHAPPGRAGTPSLRMLRQRATLVHPGEALDEQGVPRPAPELLATEVPCALAPLSLATAAALRASSGAAHADGQLYLGPEQPELAVGDTASLTGYGVWTVAARPRVHAAHDGTVGHRAYPAVQEG